jgi:hypothetical protein
MPRRDSEEEDDAPLPPGFTTLTNAICNDGGCRANLDAEGTKDDSNAYVEEKFDESTGKKRNYNGYQKYLFIKQWVTREDAILEEAEIQHEIYIEMKKFNACSQLEEDLLSQTKGD